MAFPTTPVLDDFNRSNGAIGSNWSTPAVGSSDVAPTINTNVVIAGTSVYGSAYWNVETFGPDCEVYMTIPAAATGWSAGFLTCRAQDINTASQDEYQIQIDVSGGIDLKRTINDTQSAVLLALADVINAGDKIGMRVITQGNDNLIEIWADVGAGWVMLDDYLDVNANSTYPVIANAGYIAFALYGNSAVTRSIDDFGGGTYVPLALDEALPDADIVTTGWATAPLFSKVNDASDGTVITATAS